MKRGDNDSSVSAAATASSKQLATRPSQNKPSSQHSGQSFREHRNTFPIAGFSGGSGGGNTSANSSNNNNTNNTNSNSNSNNNHAGGNQSDPMGARSPVRKYSGSILISAGSHSSNSNSKSNGNNIASLASSDDKAPLPPDLSLEDYLLDVKNTMVRVGEKLELVENVTMKMNAAKKDDDFGDR